MPTYSTEFKDNIVRKMMPPNSQSVEQICKEVGISRSTLYAWKQQYRSKGYLVPANPSTPDQWDTKSKLAAIIQTALMNEAKRAEYCREHSLYPEQLNGWKAVLESTDMTAGVMSKADKAALAADRQKIKQLERDLRRKDRALAETAALLVLSKKAEAIWGIKEED
jgi:transposase